MEKEANRKAIREFFNRFGHTKLSVSSAKGRTDKFRVKCRGCDMNWTWDFPLAKGLVPCGCK